MLLKVSWTLLFALSLIVYGALFFGAASGGSSKPSMMYLIWLAVAVGLACGLLTIARSIIGLGFAGPIRLLPFVSLWPLIWLGAAVVRAIIK